MKKFALVLFAAVASYLTPSASYADGTQGFLFGVSIIRLASETSGPTFGANDQATTILDLKAGYTLSSNIFVGGVYDSRNDVNNGSKTERTGYGVVLGYHNNGWFIDGAYYISSMYKLSSGSEVKDGSGFGVDVGHNVDLTSNTYIGLQISYKSLTYNKLNSNDESNKLKSELTPMANLGIMF